MKWVDGWVVKQNINISSRTAAHFGGKLLVLGMRERCEPAEILNDFELFLRNRYFSAYDGYGLVGVEKAKNRLKKAKNSSLFKKVATK